MEAGRGAGGGGGESRRGKMGNAVGDSEMCRLAGVAPSSPRPASTVLVGLHGAVLKCRAARKGFEKGDGICHCQKKSRGWPYVKRVAIDLFDVERGEIEVEARSTIRDRCDPSHWHLLAEMHR